MAPPTRSAFRGPITASTWDTAWGACFKSALDAHGRANARDGTLVPPLTNGEAVQLVIAWRHAAPADFPLWGQLAAIAYGWTADNGVMDLTAKQRDAMYPTQISEELWLSLQKVAFALDAARAYPARLTFDETFDNAQVQGAIAAELKTDGAAQVTFRLSKGAVVPPKPDPKQPPMPLWMRLALVYAGYRVLKNLTGGPRYAG